MMSHFNLIKTFSLFLLTVSLVVVSPAARADEPAFPKTLYVVPFLNVMVPETVSTSLFDSFVDQLMAYGDQHDVKIRILKQEIDSVDKEWLGKQYFITGEIFGYLEDSGCCSTEIEVKARIYSYRPGSVEPDREIEVPEETFFDHDVTTLEKERSLLAARIALELSELFLSGLNPQ